MSPYAKRARVLWRKGDEVREAKGEGSQGLSGAEGTGLHKRQRSESAEDREDAAEDSVAPILDGLGDVPPKPGKRKKKVPSARSVD